MSQGRLVGRSGLLKNQVERERGELSPTERIRRWHTTREFQASLDMPDLKRRREPVGGLD